MGPCLTMTYAIVGATEQIDVGASLQPCEDSSQLYSCHVVCIVSSALLIRCIRAPVVSSVAPREASSRIHLIDQLVCMLLHSVGFVMSCACGLRKSTIPSGSSMIRGWEPTKNESSSLVGFETSAC